MLALLLVAASVGLSNFAAAISLGVSGVDARTRLRVGLVFGAFESGMPVIGLLVGDHVATQLGRTSRWVGGALLIGVGLYAIISSVRAHRAAPALTVPAETVPAETVPAETVPAETVPAGTEPADAASAGTEAAETVPAGTVAAAAAVPGSGGRPPLARGSNARLLLSGLALSLDNLVVGFALGTYQIAILVGAIVIGAVSVALSLIGLELGARLGGWAGHRSDQLGGIILIGVGAAVAAGALA
jgi:manganese efflux pump family protein